jgi:ribosome-associated toxin RatA of RatAB toxin-antitoxin module
VPEHSTQWIDIEATPAQIMAVIADFDRYPEWTDAIKSTEVVEAGPDGRALKVEFQLDALGFTESYQLAYEWTGDERVEWNLTKGRLMRAQRGSYTLEEDPDGFGTLVTYELSVDLNLPLPGAIRRKAEQMIMDAALTALKERAERTDKPTSR